MQFLVGWITMWTEICTRFSFPKSLRIDDTSDELIMPIQAEIALNKYGRMQKNKLGIK